MHHRATASLSAAFWRRMGGVWLLAACLGLRAEQVLITEVMYHPPDGFPPWVEVLNNTATPFDMTDWTLSGSAMEFRFPGPNEGNPSAFILKPYERFLVSGGSPKKLRQHYNIPAGVRVFGAWSGRLKHGSDLVALKDQNGVVLSRIEFKDHGDWPLSADGAGHSLELTDTERGSDDWRNWKASAARLGSPGAPPQPRPGAGRGVVLSEVHFDASGSVDWVEVQNTSGQPIPAGSLFVAGDRALKDRMPLPEALAAGKAASVKTAFASEAAARGTPVYLVDQALNVLDARRFAPLPPSESWQAWPAGSGDWYSGSTPSQNHPNEPRRETRVVINEVMYDPPAGLDSGEYIELFNRSSETVPLDGWRLRHAVDFEFPAGTSLPPGGFLVVGADTNHLRQAYGDIPVIGNYRGKLGNRGDRIRLEDARGNFAAEVDYLVGGAWPDLPKGGGSSLELVNPAMDGRLASAWRASDESRKGEFQRLAVTGRYTEQKTLGAESDYRELNLHMVESGHLELRGITFRKTEGGGNLIENGANLSTDGSGATGWLIQGNHAGSRIEEGALHLISEGHGDNRGNRAEIDLPGLRPGDLCELSLEARWVSGSARLIAQTWDHSISQSFALRVPKNLGTPGRVNSRFQPLAPPQLDGLLHSPAVPKGDRPVRFSVHVSAASPLAKVTLMHRLDSAANDQPWQSVAMALEGGDVSPAALYSVNLDQYREDGQVVQFYVQAETASGATQQLPREGPHRPAMLVVDKRPMNSSLRSARFVISAYDQQAISAGESAKYDFRYPRLSNHYFNTTFISNERDVFYCAEIHRSGSAWNRNGRLMKAKWKPPGDQPFRNLRKLTFDDDAAGDRRYSDRFTRHLLYLMGFPANEDEFINIVVNAGDVDLREEVAPVDGEFLRRHLPGAASGDLYRIDDEWWFPDDWKGENRDATWEFKGTKNPGDYRTEWMKRTNEEADDYSALINFFEAVSSSHSTPEEIEKWVDPFAVLKVAAVTGYVADWDTFTQQRGKNGYFYRRSNDGLFQLLHWDSDAAFNSPTNTFYGPREPFHSWVEKPANLRILGGYLEELLRICSPENPRMMEWLKAQDAAAPETKCDIGTLTKWFADRRAFAEQVYGESFRAPFEIKRAERRSNKPAAVITGTAPFGLLRLSIEGRPDLKCRWTSPLEWVFEDVPLRPGENRIKVTGSNVRGELMKSLECVLLNP